MKRETIVRPGYDCKNVPCKHDPPGDHGISGGSWVYVVAEGKEALSLEILACDYPPTVVDVPPRLRTPMPGCMVLCRAATDGMECQWVDGGRCRPEVIGYLCAGEFWKMFGDPRQVEQGELFWAGLEASLVEYREQA